MGTATSFVRQPRALAVLVALALPLQACGPTEDADAPLPPGDFLLVSGPVLASFPRALRVRLMLPEGGAPGSPFWIMSEPGFTDGPRMFEAAGTLDAAAHAALTCGVPGTCSGDLDGTTGCVTLVADHVRFIALNGNDVGSELDGTIPICPTESERSDRVTVRPVVGAPGAPVLGALTVEPWAPLDAASTSTLRIMRDGVEIPSHYAGSEFGGELVLDEAFVPLGAIELDASALVDVLGHPVTVMASFVTTTTTLDDWTFETPPDPGAIGAYGGTLGVVEGALVATDLGRWPRERPFLAFVALGDLSGTSAVRIEGAQERRISGLGAPPEGGSVSVSLLHADGTRGVAVALPFDPGPTDLPVSSEGLTWLVLHSTQFIAQPRDYFAADFVRIESIERVP